MGNRFGLSNRFIVVLALTAAVLLLPNPPGLSVEGKRALAAFVFTGTVFALQPIPLPFAGLLVPVMLVALGLANSAQAFETLSRPIIILIMGSLFLAEALRKHGITRRLALVSIVASGGRVDRLLFGLMGLAALLSMWMENTATAAVLIPVALTISRQVQDEKQSRELLVLLVLGIAYSASVGGMATITGSASNAVASEFLSGVMVWRFVDWMKYGVLAVLFVFPVTWWTLFRAANVSVKELEIEVTRKELENLGGLRGVELEVLVVLGLTIIMWIGGAFLETAMRLPASFLSPAIVGMIAVSYMSLRGIIQWEDVKGVSWGMFFAIAAGLALGEALRRAGTTAWLTGIAMPLLRDMPFIFVLVIIVFASALLTNVVNNATVAAVFVPIMIEIAAGSSFNAVRLVLPLTMATTFGYALPSASGRMALISATGIIEQRKMLRYGILMTVVSSIVLIILFYALTVLNMI
ncbi:DASS family sodium-coupled anion symporter [Candidatus Bathyarchaeota archaeon]|nr:DASS family sodium-coupled anion symporter [Candidatus Bathyarchaeota archaeon]